MDYGEVERDQKSLFLRILSPTESSIDPLLVKAQHVNAKR